MDDDGDDLDALLVGLDPLKAAKTRLTHRQIQNEDLKLAVAEGQLMPVSLHVAVLSEVVSKLVTHLDTLPDVLERRLALDPAVVVALREQMDILRDSLHASISGIGHAEGAKARHERNPARLKGRAGRKTNVERAVAMKKSKAAAVQAGLL